MNEAQATDANKAAWVQAILAEQAYTAPSGRAMLAEGRRQAAGVACSAGREGSGRRGRGRRRAEKGKLSPDTIAALDYMGSCVEARRLKGHSMKISEAPAAAKRAGHAKSAGANRKAWIRAGSKLSSQTDPPALRRAGPSGEAEAPPGRGAGQSWLPERSKARNPSKVPRPKTHCLGIHA